MRNREEVIQLGTRCMVHRELRSTMVTSVTAGCPRQAQKNRQWRWRCARSRHQVAKAICAQMDDSVDWVTYPYRRVSLTALYAYAQNNKHVALIIFRSFAV